MNLDDFIPFVQFYDNDFNELVTVEVQLGNQIIQKQQMPILFASQEFPQLIKQMAQDKRPLKISFTKNDYNNSGKIIPNSLIFKNNAFINGFGERN
jgi:glutamate formiminotransferase